MKKFTLIIASILFSSIIMAQNIQMHYDFGKADDNGQSVERNYLTSTVEMFKPDNHGSTFFFIDMDYNSSNGGVQLLYWEISRGLKFWKFPMEVHLEFASGNLVAANGNGFQFNGSTMTGVNFPLQLGNVSLSAAPLFRHTIGTDAADFQFTGTWFTLLANKKIAITGFIDIWTQDKWNQTGEKDGKKWLILTEPQFWYNINNQFALGTEIEISRYFATFDGDLDFMPTVAAKWTF